MYDVRSLDARTWSSVENNIREERMAMAELTRQGSGTYRFVARETLKSIIREIDTIAELDPGKDDRVALSRIPDRDAIVDSIKALLGRGK